ncbi:MAG: neutral zinc metallopeptidase [Pseudomonadota bacterium]
MKWEGNRESDNVEDRRGGGGGGGGGFGFGGKSIGIGGIVIALLGSWLFGINPMTMLDMMGGGGGGPVTTQQSPAQGGQAAPAADRETRFMRTVLADTEDVWTKQFEQAGGTYVKPTLVLFEGATSTQCGTGEAASGPFYCPADRNVYIDLSFYRLMRERFQVEGEFAQAYVIAHEVGHHVQHQLGFTEKVNNARQRGSKREANEMSVRLELQADCYAGLWANHSNKARGILEQGDLEAALKAASAIGDDALQGKSGGRVVPDSFTHGSSEQRMRWFKRGIESGSVQQCNTFETQQL